MAPMDYGFAKTMTEEEQNRYEEFRGRVLSNSQGGMSADQNGGGYYAGYMGEEEKGTGPAVQSPAGGTSGEPAPVEPQPSKLWIAQPQNMMEVWSKYDQDPNYVDEHFTREQADTLHDYMAYQNKGKPVDQWSPLMDNDPFVTDVIQRDKWWEPAPEAGAGAGDSPVNGQSPKAQVYNPTDTEKQAFFQQKEMGDWNQLDWIGKVGAALTTTDPGLNAPDYTKKTQAAAKATSSAMAGPAALKLIGLGLGLAGAEGAAAALTNPWVLAGTAVAVGGLVFYQAVTGKEIPVFNKFLELSDIVDTTVEHAIGFGAQTYQMGKQYVQRANEDKNDAYGLMQAIDDTLKEVGQNASSMWKAGEYTYEMYGSVGDFAVDALKEVFKGEKGTKEGEAWFFNRGLNEKQTLAPGTYGAEGQENIREMFAEMDALGIEKDMQEAIMQQAVINASGTSGNVSDYVAQMLLDLDILAAPVENSAMGFVSRVTGNELGVKAAQANSGSIVTQLPFVGSVYQAVSGKKAPGGFMEWIDQYRNLARSADVSTLSSFDRFMGGIDADGKIKDFARTEKTGMTDLLPEAKVAGVGNIAVNTMNAYMDGVQDVADIRQRLAEIAGTAETGTSPVSGIANSADVLTVRDGLKAAMAKSDPEVYIKQFENSEGARATLSLAAEQLGMEVKDVLSLYAETPDVFERRVQNYAKEHNGMFAGIDVSKGVDPVSTIVRGFTTAKEGKGEPLAWDIRQLEFQIKTKLIDGMAEYYTDYYGVKPNGTINTIFDTMKSAQSLLLLGWSPSYFINNVVNNTVTAAAEGVLGFMTPKQIRTFMEAFGVTPARMDIDESAGFRGQAGVGSKGGLETFTSAAAEAKKKTGPLNELNKVLKKANDKLGVFSRLSGLMETMQGNQLTTVAIQQYWRQRWKRGEGFHMMPDFLVNAIEAQTPGMSNIIYQAIENGLNMNQVKQVLLSEYAHPDVGTVMKDTVNKLFRGEAMVYEEMFEKSGIMNELRERIANCKTEAERTVVIEDCRDKILKFVDNLRREDLIQRANNVAAVVESEGLAPVAQMMSEMEMNHQEFWLRIRQEWTDIKQKIREENITGNAAQTMQAEMVARHDKEWADLYKQEASTVAGILKGLGFENEAHVKYVGLLLENQKNWQEFNQQKGLELKRFYDRRQTIMGTMGIHKNDRTIMIGEAWEDYNIAVSELYKQHFDRESEIQVKMDAVFVEGYEHATGKSGEQFRQNFKRIREIRQQMYEMQQDAHNKTKDMSKAEQAEFYEEFNPIYNKMIRDIGNLGDANSKIIEDTSAERPGYQEHAETKLTPEQTVQATETMEVNNQERERAMRERSGFLDRDGIKKGWIDAGRTPAEADLMMAVFDSAAESWAKQNGMYPDEFYSMAAQMKGIATWLPGTEDGKVLHQTAAEYAAKYHDQIQQYIDTLPSVEAKRIQMEIISSTNPMTDDYHVGIRSAEDIKTFAEAFDADTTAGEIDIYPDWTQEQCMAAIESGQITVYSSHPITDGVFVTPSKMMAQDYAGGRNAKIYSATIDVNSVAWINSTEGQFAKIEPEHVAPRLHQMAVDKVKGTFEHTDVGNIIRMLEASDVSTMVHESGHLFRRTLSTPLLTEFTTWAGFDSVADFQELEARVQRSDPTLTADERQRYVDAEEKFARGFEQYLMDGSAPTPGLKAVFKAFRDYLLDIYKNVKAAVTGNDYSKQGEFVFHGKTGDEVLNINAEINGVKLRDIFDRMLTDDVQRVPGYKELVQNLRTKLGQDRHNMRMSDKALDRRAQVEVTRTILSHWNSYEEAAAELAKPLFEPIEINGWRVDDATLYEALQAAANDPTMDPFAQAQWHEVKGTNTYAHSNKGSGRYQMQYKVVELNDLQPSNVWFGDQLVINEDYPADVQARNRTADQSDVYAHAVNLDPGKLIDEMRSIDRGAPIVGEGNLFVESGNGRVLSMLYARDHFPEQWANYQEYLRNSVSDYGIDPAQLDGFENPVLIRERLGGNRIDFAEDANSDTSKAMTASENALTDANRMNMVTLSNLDIVPGENTDTFDTEKNAQVTVEWLRSLPEADRAQYSATNRNGDLVLSADGKTRFINALFATLYATPESMEIIKSFSETADSNITALESALKQSLPEMARAEGLIQSGSRAESLSITQDVMAAAGLLNDAREAGLNIHDYLAQSVIPGLERWTPTQALLAGFFGDAKNNVKKMRDFFNVYGEEVYKAGDPNQISLFGEAKTREQMIDDALATALGARDQGSGARGQASTITAPQGSLPPDTLRAPGGNDPAAPVEGPALFQSVMDSNEKWTSEFAKTLDENKQRTFDDGLSMPLDQADQVYLRGELNVKYDTMVQRLLRDFSNDKNLSADQYLYAHEYMEWWVQGSEGEAPKGNPLWEKQIQQMVMQDFQQIHPQEVAELMRRYKKGAEVDPDTAVPTKGDYFKRTYEFTHGIWNIAGNVYRDGKLVAFLPEELDLMKKTIDVDGQSYQVLGVDMRNPEGLVYWDPVLEIVRTVNVGKPEGYDAPRNPFMFIKPSHQGSSPQTMPVADAYSELSSKYLMPALDAFGEAYTKADTDAKTAKLSGLNTQTRAQLLQWLDEDVARDMRQEKYRAVKYSDMKKDAAMLNYNQRYGFDPILTMLSPYQFWYTRSMWKWAKRMIDKPALGNAYERMKEYEDRNRQENLPSRLAGKFRIAMPFLPDWMGGSYYIDLMSQLYPFSQFGQGYSNMNAATLRAKAEEILEQQVRDGLITAEDKLKAVNEKKGAIWDDAYAQAEIEVGQSDGLNTLAGQFISPNIFYSWWEKKQNGEDPGTLNSTRTGNAIRALTSDIPLVSKLGSVVGDAMSIPEKALRKLYGLEFDEFGAYGDQQIRKQISQMAADGEIDWRKALNAMNEKSGTIWDMAADRQRREAMLKVPGFAGAEAAKQFVKGNANFGQALGSILMSMAGGGSLYPQGEQTLRQMKALRDQAYIDEANGKTGAVSEWYDKYGDLYLTRTATYISDPEELMKFTLYNEISRKYFDQPYAQQIQIQKDLGPEFYYALFNKETKNYEAVPTQKLAEWNAALGGTNPNVGSIDVEGVTRVMQLSQPVINAQEEHDRIKKEQFPGISVIQDMYYALPKDQRKDFIQQFPQLADYWEWNRTYKEEHKDYVQWEEDRSDVYNERTLYQSYSSMSQRTQQNLEYSRMTGKDISDFSRQELERLYNKYANTSFMSFDDYVKQLKEWK